MCGDFSEVGVRPAVYESFLFSYPQLLSKSIKVFLLGRIDRTW